MMAIRVPIENTKELQPGDKVILTFKTTNWVWSQAAEIALIESYCEGRGDWEILSNSLPADNRIEFKILIKAKYTDESLQTASAVPVTALAIAGVIIFTGLVVWLTLDKVEQLVEAAPKAISEAGKTAGGQIALAGTGAIGIAILIYIVTKALGMWK